jgi:hypothetical protein
MKTPAFALAAFTLFALGCTETTAPKPAASTVRPIGGPQFAAQNQGNGVVHSASAGGPDADIAGPGGDKSYALVAVEHGNGEVTGEWQDGFGGDQGGVHVAVNCLSVDGNKAWISGVITNGTFNGADVSGQPAITMVVDNGASANDPPDQISFSFVGVGIPCTARPNLPLLTFTRGQVKVN